MIINSIRLALKSISRNKKNKIFIVVIILLFFMLFVDVIFMKNICTYINNYMNKNLNFRSFYTYKLDFGVVDKEAIEEIKKVKHISDVYISKYASYYLETDLKMNGLSGELMVLYGSDNVTPKSIIGKQVKDLRTGELICPYNFYPDSGAYDYKIDEKKLINPNQILNKEFNVYYLKNSYTDQIINGETEVQSETLSKKFKIVGFYDNQSIMNTNNDCYGIEDDIKLFVDALNPPREDVQDNSLIIVVDKPKNLNEVKRELNLLEYIVNDEARAGIDKVAISFIFLISFSLFAVIFCSILFLIYNYLNKKIRNERKYLGVLRACGYTKNQCILMQMIEIMLLVGIGYFVCLILFSLCFSLYVKRLFNFISYSGFYVSNSFLILFILFIVLLTFVVFIVLKIVLPQLDNSINCLLDEK